MYEFKVNSGSYEISYFKDSHIFHKQVHALRKGIKFCIEDNSFLLEMRIIF